MNTLSERTKEERLNPNKVWDKVFPQQWYSKRPKDTDKCIYCNRLIKDLDEEWDRISVIWNNGYGITVCHKCWNSFAEHALDNNLRLKLSWKSMK